MTIHFEARGRTALITIDRPERRNSFDMDHFGMLAAAWVRFRDDDELWTAVITGVRDVFCVGADLKSFVPMVQDNIEALAAGDIVLGGGDYPDNAPLVAVLRDFDLYKPVIAAINGLCAGGGMEMLNSIDLRVASEDARFSVPEVRRGLFPGGGTTVHLPRQLSYCHAMEMLLTGDFVDAQRAYEIGLVNRVVPRDQVVEAALALAHRIEQNGPCAVRAIKESAVKSLRVPLDQALGAELGYAAQVFSTDDAAEGTRAFIEKRPPVWKGK